MIIVAACLIAVLSAAAIVMGCCFMKRTTLETRKPTVSTSLPRRLETNAYTNTDTRDKHMPSCSHHGQANRTSGSGYDRLHIGKDNILKFTDMEPDSAQIYSHLARHEADMDWADVYDTTLRQLGRKRADGSYNKVTIQEK
ncbi:uncharacterized protein LOC124257062 isoform X2 [Haliotis rubra]|nr:uncharacterized protein LOC124257062 isoform X2 [Haliotis rubra]